MSYLKKITNIPRNIIISIISLYQRTLSPDHGWLKVRYPNGYCRFSPSCSDYSKQAFKKYGFLKGGWLATWRIMRCNPFSCGGEDKLK